MRTPSHRIFSTLGLGGLLTLLPATALAAKPVTVELVAVAEDMPEQVCVVSGAGEHELNIDMYRMSGTYALLVDREKKAPKDSAGREEKAAIEPKKSAGREEKAAIEALANAAQKCSTEDCNVKPHRKLTTRPLFIRCSEAGDSTGRVLVLEIKAEKSDGPQAIAVSDVRLTGSTLDLDISHSITANDLALHVVGGNYADNATKLSEDYNTLNLSPRCVWVNVERPPMLFPERRQRRFESNYCSRGNEHEDAFELFVQAGSSATKDIRVKYVRQITIGSFHLYDKPLPADTVEFTAKMPVERGAPVSLVPQTIAFSWRKDECFYIPNRACPEARIEQTGFECKSISNATTNVCDYICGAPNLEPNGKPLAGGDFENLQIVFEDKLGESEFGQQWTLNINAIDQELVGHVSDGERVIKVDVQDHPLRPPLDRLFGIQLRYITLGGEVAERTLEILPPRPALALHDIQQYVAVPDVGCRGTIDYRYLGEREYHEASAHIASGKIILMPPLSLGRRFYAVASVSGGVVIPHPIGSFPARENPRGYPLAELEVGLGHWPRDAREGRFEYRLGIMQSVNPVETINPGVVRPIPYTRLLATAASYSAWLGKPCSKCVAVAVGGGISAVWGRPTLQADAKIFDPSFGSFDFGIRPFFDLRIRVTRIARLELFLRHWVLFFEDHVKWSTDYLGTTELKTRFTTRNGVTAGVAVSL